MFVREVAYSGEETARLKVAASRIRLEVMETIVIELRAGSRCGCITTLL